MASEFEKFSRLVLDAVHELRTEFGEHREEMADFRQEWQAFRLETTQRLTGIERELADIDRRLDDLEHDIADIRGYAKELDELRSRLRSIEQHLGLERRIAA